MILQAAPFSIKCLVMPARLILPHSFYQAITAHARAGYPDEVCGLLRGRRGRVSDILPARNTAPNPQRDYQVDADSLLQALRWEDEGDELVAIYHSHPTSPAYPSAVDAANAFYPDSVYLILSLQRLDAPALRGFQLRPEAVFRDEAAEAFLRDIPFEPARPGLWGFYLAPDAAWPARAPRPLAAGIAFYLVFDENSGRQPPPVRLISVLPVALTIQL